MKTRQNEAYRIEGFIFYFPKGKIKISAKF